jgi:hypothetical protein
MYDFDARAMLPIYAAIEPDDYVRHYEPKKSYIKPEKVTRKSFGQNAASNEPLRMKAGKFFRDLWKKGIAFWAAVTFYTVFVCCITGVIVRNNTTLEVTERVTAEMRQNFSAYLADQEEAASRERFLSGEASLEAAITEDAKKLAGIGQGVLNTYTAADLEDAEKVMLCALCRVFSGGEFAGITSIADAVKQPGQWWGYSEGMRYTDEVYDTALKLSAVFHKGEPMPCSTDMVYAGWNGNDIVLRNQWEANANARYY